MNGEPDRFAAQISSGFVGRVYKLFSHATVIREFEEDLHSQCGGGVAWNQGRDA